MEVKEKNRILHKLNKTLASRDIEVLLIDKETDILYLAGFYTHGAFILLKSGEKAKYFVDPMNERLATKELSGLNLDIIVGYPNLELVKYINSKNIKRIHLSLNNISALSYQNLRLKLKKVKFIEAKDYVGEMRAIKSENEVKILRKAAKDTIGIWKFIKKNISHEMTEKDIAKMIDLEVCDKGYINSFPTISAVAENTAYPHAIPTARRLKKGEHVLVDFGLKIDGYCSDLTRTLTKGRINRQISHINKIVHLAHDSAIKMVKAGANIASIAELANKICIDNNLGKYLLHGLGHGVGLDIHEDPFIGQRSTGKLEKGMIITIEPGLYIPGVGGIREEDMILVGASGGEVLTQ